MNGVTQREWSFLLLLWGLSDPRIAELRKMPKSFIIKLYSETQVSGRLGMSGGISPRHAQNPLSGERRKTLSITHHALSPPPSHHHLYIIHLINWLQRFYRIIMSLKRPFVPKSDVKQWFTTTAQIKFKLRIALVIRENRPLIVLMLGQRRRWWTSIETKKDHECPVFFRTHPGNFIMSCWNYEATCAWGVTLDASRSVHIRTPSGTVVLSSTVLNLWRIHLKMYASF